MTGKQMGIRQEVAFKSNSEIFKRLEEVANVATLSPAERRRCDADIKIARDSLNQIRGAFRDGEKKGRAEGRVEGRAEGRAAATLEHAKSMLAAGITPELTAAITGLPIEKILSISKN